MHWKQFLTPVQSVAPQKALAMLNSDSSIQLIDVRQPVEYSDGHIPGARLIPLGNLLDQLCELDKEKPVLVYCAIGGRSRVAAQLLSGQKFQNIYNITGGLKSWKGWESTGEYDQGLQLFTGLESLEEILLVAYTMELALNEFYTEMANHVTNEQAASLFLSLANIEKEHETNIASQYAEFTGKVFPKNLNASETLEGGLTTAEYMSRLGADMETPHDILIFAMSIECQAMDLYLRASDKAPNAAIKKELLLLSSEEKSHLNRLADVMDSIYVSKE
ncbi:rhodanese-like domain-containing protein [Halodesulfovibrio aestuarii]|uniref:Rhodanese-like domain-containing protein n=1 Tax=Halodesulfovibrio aestuarii TaxID=126333 RepID=A0ABV4JT24_9BACT